jgi:hypothetical protein
MMKMMMNLKPDCLVLVELMLINLWRRMPWPYCGLLELVLLIGSVNSVVAIQTFDDTKKIDDPSVSTLGVPLTNLSNIYKGRSWNGSSKKLFLSSSSMPRTPR